MKRSGHMFVRSLGALVLLSSIEFSGVPLANGQAQEPAAPTEQATSSDSGTAVAEPKNVSTVTKNGKIWIEESEPEQAFPAINLPSFAPAIEKLGAAVVNIRTEGKANPYEGMGAPPGYPQQAPGNPGGPGGQQAPGSPGGQDPQSPFDYFRMPQDQQQRRFSSLGSGFVIHPDGYIVTNHHVVEKATKILVSFRDDKRTYTADLVGSDPKTDLALIKVNHTGKLPAAPLGNSDNLRPGDWVIAIGNPFRLGHTATVGIVSAVSRRIPGGKPYDSFIQTDASINPGNSGGPLFNSKGEVVGVNTAIFSPGRYGSSGFNIGIGFAIPINQVKAIISQVVTKGKVTRGWLGVLIQTVSQDVAEAMKLHEARGALVADVVPESPAAKAGFERGDVILSFDGRDVQENDDLPQMVAETEVGKKVNVVIVREGKEKILKTTIQELEDGQEEPQVSPSEESRLGLTVQEMTPDIARSLGVDDAKGVVITGIDPESPAADAGLLRGDIILEVGSKTVNSATEFRNYTKDLKADAPVLLLVRRNNNTIFFTLRVE